MTVGRLVQEEGCIVRFAKNNSVYILYGFDRCSPANPEADAIPQGYLVELSYPVFRRVDGVWIILQDEYIAEIVAECQLLCERGVIPSFEDLLLEFDKRDVDGLYSIGVLGGRFTPSNKHSGRVGKNRFVYGGLMLHELYAGVVLRHLKTYWYGAVFKIRNGSEIARKITGKTEGLVGEVSRKMNDRELAKFAKMITDGVIELHFSEDAIPLNRIFRESNLQKHGEEQDGKS
jgi:hypothetical protein